jgi:hypothetical protein
VTAPGALPLASPSPIAAAPEDGSDLRIQVLDPEGKPTKAVALLLWRRLAADEPADSFVWTDTTTGIRWAYSRNWNDGYPAPEPFGFHALPAGTYRVAASRFNSSPKPSYVLGPSRLHSSDPDLHDGTGPFALSDPVTLDGKSSADLQIRQEAAGLFDVHVHDRLTGRPIPDAIIRVRRLTDGYPMFHGWGNGLFADRTDKDGLAIFIVPPGRYSTEFLGRRASGFGQLEYEPLDGPILPHSSGSNKDKIGFKMILVDGRPLTREEIGQRWPFVVRGTVTDFQGRPLPGVKLTASAGMGTLFPTGETTSGPDGSYLLRFSPGVHVAAESLGLNAVVLGASLPGYFPLELARDPSFLAVRREPTPEELGEMKLADPSTLLVANRPFDLDLVMTPSASIQFIFDATFRQLIGPMGYRITVEALEPSLSNNSLPGLTFTGNRFEVPMLHDEPTRIDLPPGRYRFTLSWPDRDGREPATTQEMHLDQTGLWTIDLSVPDPSTPTVLPARMIQDAQSTPASP